MCARFTLTHEDYEGVVEELEAVATDEVRRDHRPRFNVGPTDRAWIVTERGGTRHMLGATWGLPARVGGRPIINARSETAHERPLFRDAMRTGRCVVVTDGFYEWGGPRGERQPWWFQSQGRGLLLLGGLLFDTRAEGGAREIRFVVLTTPPNAEVARVHDRMPSIVTRGSLSSWLRPGPPVQHHAGLETAPDGALRAIPVAKAVDRTDRDDAGLIQAIELPKGLFGL
jgi:putative SOS response-associated peptidase YedK